MPINTSSTGATYGKSTDPLCPLGFHPQVRWPTRCKRCFRDYKEHSDDKDKAKYGNLNRGASVDDDDPWSARKAGFQRSRSLDVNMMESTSRYAPSASASSSYSSRTTTTAPISKTDDDVPQWKKNMLERQRKEAEEAAKTTSSYTTSRFTSSNQSKKAEEEDYITRRRRERAEADTEKVAANTFRSRSVQPESNSAGYDSTESMLSYDRYVQKKTEIKPTSSTGSASSTMSTARVSFAPQLATTQPAPSSSTYGGYGSSSSTAAKSSTSSSYGSTYSTSTTTTTTTTSSTSTTPSWSSAKKAVPTPAAVVEEPSWKPSTPATPSWKKPAESAMAPEPEKPKATPSWKKPIPVPVVAKKEPLGKISETTPTATTRSWKKKAEEIAPTPTPAPPKQDTPAPTTKTTPTWKKTTITATASPPSEPSTTTSLYSTTISSPAASISAPGVDPAKLKTLENDIIELKDKVVTLQREKGTLQRERDEASKKPISFESAKAAEAAAELRRAKEKISEYELSLSKIEKEKNGLNVKVRELESVLDKKPKGSETTKSLLETQTKLKFYENKLNALEKENDKLQNNVSNMEAEMDEVQDNFREDEVDEYRTLKRDLETQSKNVRVLQFKLKKAERSVSDLQVEKADLETKMKSGSTGGSSMSSFDTSNKIRTLERELEQKTLLNTKYEQQIAELRSGSSGSSGGPKKGSAKGGPVLSRTGSVERSVEDQLLKDLQDSIERENDLKEQLNMAEEEGNEKRKKMSRIEDENESLSQQLKKMTVKKRRSPSPAGMYGRQVIEKDEGISEDGEELSLGELKVQLEVSEGETGLLRKKVDNLLTENLKLTKEIREINTKLTDEKKKRSTPSYGNRSTGPEKENSYYEQKLDDLQTDLNSTRVKLIEKEREVERLDAQVKAATKSSSGKGKLSRSGSQDEDLQKKIQVIEQEASVLNDKVNKLETENEKLKTENKDLTTSKYGKKPASTQENLQMVKFALEEKVKKLEIQLKDQTKKMAELQENLNIAKKDSLEADRLKRANSNMEFELTRVKSAGESDKRKVEKLERELNIANDKSDKAQRELITAEREKRKADEEKKSMDSSMTKSEGDVRMLTRERDRLKDEAETAKAKNRDNLQQTQEGLKAFKDQIEAIKNDLQDEKTKHRDTKRTSDDRIRQMTTDLREVKQALDDKLSDIANLNEKLTDIDDKWTKSKRINKTKQDKIDTLDQQLEDTKSRGSSSSAELSQIKTKLRDAERNIESKETRITQLERDIAAGNANKQSYGSSNAENDKLKKEIEELKKAQNSPTSAGASNRTIQSLKDQIAKHELTEEQLVVAKARLTTEKEELEYVHREIKRDYDTIRGELSTLRQTYNVKADEWIKEKLDLQQRMKDLQDSLLSSAGGGWENERERFKNIIDDRDNQITQLKIEGDVARSQLSSLRKECDEIKLKLMDYEKMSKFQKAATADTSAITVLEEKLADAKKQISNAERDHRSEVNNMKMKYDGKIAVMSEEIASMKTQATKYRREREHYKEMLENAQKTRSGRTSGGDEVSEYKNKVSDLHYQIHAMEDDLAESKLDASKANAQATAQKSTFEIQISELNSKINELEEEALIESGRARIAGTRTKMELAWQKERESQKKLINELNTMARDLKSTLLEVEKERDREKLESKRKIGGMKNAFEEEQDDTKKQITDLQYDLLELRDAHAKLRTTNDKLRRDKEKFERERDEYRYIAKEKSRTEQGEEKKVTRLLKDMDDFFNTVPQILGETALKPSGDISVATRADPSTKNSFKQLLLKLQDSKNELETLHKMNEEEREKMTAKRALGKRTGSVEREGQDSPRGRTPGGSSRSTGAGSSRFRKSVSIGETIAEGDALWKSTDSRGSNESLASNASIPLPIPVRTRSAVGGSESGYSSDYNAMSIRRLERDTSVDRLSTGSRESGMSTQSEWVAGEKKKKKAGLIGKLKRLTQGKEEKEFGSGSDISSASIASSSVSAFARAAKKRGISVDRSKSKEREKPKNPEQANEPFDKFFSAAASSGVGTTGSTIPRTYRRL